MRLRENVVKQVWLPKRNSEPTYDLEQKEKYVLEKQQGLQRRCGLRNHQNAKKITSNAAYNDIK